jgi:hypothetical protein
MFCFLKRFLGKPVSPAQKKLQPEAQYVVYVSDFEVRCERPDGRSERVAAPYYERLIDIGTRYFSEGESLHSSFGRISQTSHGI